MKPFICLGSGYLPELKLERICSIASDTGFKGVELWVELPDIWEKLCKNFNQGVKYVRETLEKFDLIVTIHGAVNDLNLSSYNPKIRKITVEELKENIKFCGQIGAEILTIHSSTTFKDAPTEWDIEYFTEGIRELLPFCEDYDVKLSIETPKIEDTLAVVTPEIIAQCMKMHEKVWVTYDTSHVIGHQHNYSEGLKIAEKLKEKILEMHLGWNNSKGQNTHAPLQTCQDSQFFDMLKTVYSYCNNLKFVVLEIDNMNEQKDKISILERELKIARELFSP
ncbi:MAG: sugar phosphate isomerase/epimerase family protein [Candidatus Hodarchaeota archaeon]